MVAMNSNVMFRFPSEVVETTLIRKKTFSEVWAQLGGAVAGALGLISLAFHKSGFLDKSNKELLIFKFLPMKLRLRYTVGQRHYRAKTAAGPPTTPDLTVGSARYPSTVDHGVRDNGKLVSDNV